MKDKKKYFGGVFFFYFYFFWWCIIFHISANNSVYITFSNNEKWTKNEHYTFLHLSDFIIICLLLFHQWLTSLPVPSSHYFISNTPLSLSLPLSHSFFLSMPPPHFLVMCSIQLLFFSSDSRPSHFLSSFQSSLDLFTLHIFPSIFPPFFCVPHSVCLFMCVCECALATNCEYVCVLNMYACIDINTHTYPHTNISTHSHNPYIIAVYQKPLMHENTHAHIATFIFITASKHHPHTNWILISTHRILNYKIS